VSSAVKVRSDIGASGDRCQDDAGDGRDLNRVRANEGGSEIRRTLDRLDRGRRPDHSGSEGASPSGPLARFAEGLRHGKVVRMRAVAGITMVLAILGSALAACGGAPAGGSASAADSGGPLPVVSPEDPYAWFDKPLSGFKLALEPYEVVLHASAFLGIATVELRITGEPMRSFEDPAPAETLVTLRHTWTPPRAGRYVLQARTMDYEGHWSDNADVSVEVVDSGTPTAEPTLTATPTLQAGLTEPTFWPETISYARACGEQAVTAVIGAGDPASVKVVVAFYRVVDQASGEATTWESLAMNPQPDGRFKISIQPAPSGSALRSVVSPWIERQGEAFAGRVQMQFALQLVSGDVVRSRVYDAAMLRLCAP